MQRHSDINFFFGHLCGAPVSNIVFEAYEIISSYYLPIIADSCYASEIHSPIFTLFQVHGNSFSKHCQ